MTTTQAQAAVRKLATDIIRDTRHYCELRDILGIRAGYALQAVNTRRSLEAFKLARGAKS